MTPALPTTIAARLARRLAEEEVSVGVIAKRLNVHQCMLRKWLDGSRFPGPKCRARLSHFLRLTETQLEAQVAADREAAEGKPADK